MGALSRPCARSAVTPNPSLKRRPATAAAVWRLQAAVNIILPPPAGVCLHGRLSSNVRRHTNQRPSMSTLSEVQGRFASDLAALSSQHRLWIQRHTIEPRLLEVTDTPGEPVVAVAKVGTRFMYWSNFEEGWELDQPDNAGKMTTRGSSQLDLSQLIERLIDH
jgi:hypothetical protein